LAQLALNEGKPERAIAAVEKAVENKSQVVEPYLFRSQALVQEGQYDEAEKETRPLIDEFREPPQLALTYRTLAWAKYHQMRFEDSYTFAKESLKYEPNSQQALFLLGASKISLKSADGGIAEVQGYVRSNPNWAPGYETLGQLQGMAGHYDDAERSFQKALQLDPKRPESQILWSEVKMKQGKIDPAIEILSKLVASDPQQTEAQIRLGQLSEMKGNWGAAESYYSKALQLDPGNALAKNNLASVYAEHGGNIDLALRLAQEAKEAVPDNADVSDTLAWILVKKRNYPTAIQLLRDCVQKEPDNASFNYHLGVAYSYAGEKPEAKRSLLLALKVQPDFANAEDAKKLLASMAN
jgi:tetratricopeptide (TPR) repeat protein